MKKIVLVLGVIIAIFAASNVVRSFQDYSAAQELYPSMTDALLAEMKPDQRPGKPSLDRPWPPRHRYYEEQGRYRDDAAKAVIEGTPEHTLMLCDEKLKAKTISNFSVYFLRKRAAIYYPLHSASIRHARAAERDWVTTATTEAEKRITATLKSGHIRVRDFRREYFSEARRLLGPDDPSPPSCP